MVIDALAYVRAGDAAALRAELGASGDVEMDSQEAEAVIATVEGELDRELPGPSDLEPEEVASVNALVGLLERRL